MKTLHLQQERGIFRSPPPVSPHPRPSPPFAQLTRNAEQLDMTLLACVPPGNLNRGSDIERGASRPFVTGINSSSRLDSGPAARLLMLLIPVGTGRRSQRA